MRLRWIAPDENEIERGNKYVFQIDDTRAAPGVIFTEPRNIQWRFECQPRRSTYSPLNLVSKPDFVLFDTQNREILRVIRERRLPPRFRIVEHQRTVGKISLRSILRNKYGIEFDGGPTWLFRMTLFSVCFPGVSSAGTRLWVRVGPSKREWNLLVPPEADHLYLLAGLAFIHREWWCYA